MGKCSWTASLVLLGTAQIPWLCTEILPSALRPSSLCVSGAKKEGKDNWGRWGLRWLPTAWVKDGHCNCLLQSATCVAEPLLKWLGSLSMENVSLNRSGYRRTKIAKWLVLDGFDFYRWLGVKTLLWSAKAPRHKLLPCSPVCFSPQVNAWALVEGVGLWAASRMDALGFRRVLGQDRPAWAVSPFTYRVLQK